ncbi:MAG TPA: DNA polymerase III subunit gamma/tau [Trueperaceae bacterium]|nr:DNA polymerase III subunit gamma/tau [Trueperaceae bacterium]
MSALYQRARPVTFDQVVGQEHVKDVLGSAVARGLTGHAYLFSGPRGVGKTTTARLLAMAVNCDREDPRERPCGQCESCRLVREGSHPDVMELDAASNNSVDDVRALREQVGLASLRGGTRVWILDEAHMLSRPAANALLKTLEEPPAGLMFVLATTEPEKLPPTILSRCQHFRFRRLTDAEILGKLERLCDEAGVEADTEALALVARAADGAMRDAESLLERLLVAGMKVTAQDAEDALGLPPRERLAALAEALHDGDLAVTLTAAGELYRAGFAPRTLAEQLGRTLRDMLHATLQGESRHEQDVLVRLIHALDEEQERFVRRDDLYSLEVAIIKAANAGAGIAPGVVHSQGPQAHTTTAVTAVAGLTAAASSERPLGTTSSRHEQPASAGAASGAADTVEAAEPSQPTSPPRQSADAEPRSGPSAAGHQEASRKGGGSPQEAGPAKAFSWHAVRTAAAPQIKAFLQPAQVREEGGVVTLEFGDSWRFHYDQVVARRDELETLIAKVAGPGYEVEIVGPRGTSGGRKRPVRGASADRAAPGGSREGDAAEAQGTAGSTSSGPADEAEPAAAGAERRTQGLSTDEPSSPAAMATDRHDQLDAAADDAPRSLYGDLPEGFWGSEVEEAAPDGAVAAGPLDASPPPGAVEPSQAGEEGALDPGGGTSFSRLQALFPGRVVEFVPHAKPADEETAALPAEDEDEGYDGDGQDRLGFGALPPGEG